MVESFQPKPIGQISGIGEFRAAPKFSAPPPPGPIGSKATIRDRKSCSESEKEVLVDPKQKLIFGMIVENLSPPTIPELPR